MGNERRRGACSEHPKRGIASVASVAGARKESSEEERKRQKETSL